MKLTKRAVYLHFAEKELQSRLTQWEILRSSNMSCDQIMEHIIILIEQSEEEAHKYTNIMDYLNIYQEGEVNE